MFDWLIPGLLLLTGATGLVYEVVAGRLLSLHLGSSGSSQAITLATFLGGMALGAVLAERVLRRRLQSVRAPLLGYAALEAFIGLWALALPATAQFCFGVFEQWSQGQLPSSHSDAGMLAKLALAAVLVLPLTAAMGATLPVLAAAVERSVPGRGVALVSRFYILNSAGAAVGAALGGFVLIEKLGLHLPLQFGGVLNLAVAAVVVAVGRGPAGPVLQPQAQPTGHAEVPKALAFAAFATGAVALTAEVVWTRLVGLLLGSSVYAFAFMLVVVIAGISAGSAIAAKAVVSGHPAARVLSASQALAAAAGTLLLVRLDSLPVQLAELRMALPSRADAYSSWLWQAFAVVGLHFLPAAMALGASFPALLAAARDAGAATDRATSRILAANTLGNLVGSLGCGFLLMPALGIEGALLLGVGLSLLVSLLVLPRPWQPAALAVPGVVALSAALLLVVAPPQGYALVAGMFRLRDKRPEQVRPWLAEQRKNFEILLRNDGKDATITVHRAADRTISLRTNGKSDGSTGIDVVTQILSGLLGPVYRPHGQQAFVVGLGTGQTAAALAANPRWQVHVVELSPAVVDAVPLFAAVNDRVWQKPNVRITVADAREILRTLPDHSLDVIASEPSNPWLAGVADLFTLESFARIRQKLRPGGVLVQWLQSYETSDTVVRRVVCTLQQAFGHVVIYRLTTGDLGLVASDQPLQLDLAAAATALQDPSTQLFLRGLQRRAVPVNLDELLAANLCSEARVAELCQGFAEPLRELEPEIEYRAPRDFFAGSSAIRTVLWLDQRAAATPAGVHGTELQRWLALHPLDAPRRQSLFEHLVAINHPLDTVLASALVPTDQLPKKLRRAFENLQPLSAVPQGRRPQICTDLRRSADWLTHRPYTVLGPAVADATAQAWAELCVDPMALPVFLP